MEFEYRDGKGSLILSGRAAVEAEVAVGKERQQI